MSEPLSPELEQKAQELAARIRGRSADSILAMARRLVEMHGGQLTGHSDGLGHGSEFVVRLPLANASLGLQTPPYPKPATRQAEAGVR